MCIYHIYHIYTNTKVGMAHVFYSSFIVLKYYNPEIPNEMIIILNKTYCSSISVYTIISHNAYQHCTKSMLTDVI